MNQKETELQKMCTTFGYVYAIKNRLEGKSFDASYVLESEVGEFPSENLEAFGRRMLQLQGHDLLFLENEAGVSMHFEVYSIPNDRMLLLMLVW